MRGWERSGWTAAWSLHRVHRSFPAGGSMRLSSLTVPILAFSAFVANPGLAVSQQPERHTISGDDIAVYTLVRVARIEGGPGSAVVVELSRSGRDLDKLRVGTGPVRGRETLRVSCPDDAIVD